MSGLLGDYHPMNNRPMLKNADGSISTEETITIEVDGRYYNIPTIFNGVRVPQAAAELLFKAGDIKPVGEFDSLDSAVNAARDRSNRLGRGLLGK